MVIAARLSLHDVHGPIPARRCNGPTSAGTTGEPDKRTSPRTLEMRKALSISHDKVVHSPTIGRIPKAAARPAVIPPAANCDSSGSCGMVGVNREFLSQGAVRKARTLQQMGGAA